MANEGNKAVNLTIKLLNTFAKEGTSMTVAEITRFLNISRVTAQSLVDALENANYIEKDPSTGKYSLGYALFSTGNRYVYKYSFLHAASDPVKELSTKENYKINVSVLKPTGELIILLTQSPSLVPYMVVGSTVAGNVSASGKIQLACLPDDKRKAVLDIMDFKKMTMHSITDREVLEKQLDEFKAQGYAIEKEELAYDRACIAAPIYDMQKNVIASVSISTDTKNMEEKFEKIKNDVLSLADNISKRLGYNS